MEGKSEDDDFEVGKFLTRQKLHILSLESFAGMFQVQYVLLDAT